MSFDATVVGSGIMGEGLAGGNVAIALLANALATCAGFANPIATLAETTSDTFAGIRHSDAPVVIAAQLTGAAVITESYRWLLAPPDEEVQLSDDAPARSALLTEGVPGILINELRMGNHMNKSRRVPILVKGLEGWNCCAEVRASQFSR